MIGLYCRTCRRPMSADLQTERRHPGCSLDPRAGTDPLPALEALRAAGLATDPDDLRHALADLGTTSTPGLT